MGDPNINFTFNDQLREIPENPPNISQYVLLLLAHAEMSQSDPTKLASSLGEAGAYLRILGRLNEAGKHLARSIDIIEKHQLGKDHWIVQSMRLAHVYQWQKDFEKASLLLEEVRPFCAPESSNLAFYWQHVGKNFFDQGHFENAIGAFESALKIRKTLGSAQSLIESSQYAVDVSRKKLEEAQKNHGQ